MNNGINNLQDFIKKNAHYLKQFGIQNAKKELEWFCEKKFHFSLLDIKSKSIDLSNQQTQALKNFIYRRKRNEPFQYIVNSAPFLNYEFYVDASVLIPRPETETMIDLLKNNHFNNGLDVGTGCGNIAITLKLENIVDSITAIDCSAQAIKIAKKNFKKYNISKIDFLHQDIFKHTFKKKYDLVVSNPPYINYSDYNLLPKDIKNHEPDLALTDFNDGYTFYKYFAKNINELLNPKGKMLLEIGLENTKDRIESFFLNKANIIWHKDYNKNYRVLELNV